MTLPDDAKLKYGSDYSQTLTVPNNAIMFYMVFFQNETNFPKLLYA